MMQKRQQQQPRNTVLIGNMTRSTIVGSGFRPRLIFWSSFCVLLLSLLGGEVVTKNKVVAIETVYRKTAVLEGKIMI